MSRALLYGLWGAALLAVATGCKTSSTSASSSGASTPSAIAPETKTGPVFQDRDNLCEVYDKLSEYMFETHLSRQPSEKPAMSKASFDRVLSEFSDYLSDDATARDAWTPIEANARASGINDCKAYLMLLDAMFANPSIRAAFDMGANEGKKFRVGMIRYAISDLARSMDGISFYLSPSDASSASGSRSQHWGTGLRLLERSDYLLGRKPRYVVVRGLWPDSANQAQSALLTRARIHAIEFVDNEAIATLREKAPEALVESEGRVFVKVSHLRFSSTQSLLNDLDTDDSSRRGQIGVLLQSPADGFASTRTVTLHVGGYTPLPVEAAALPLPGGRFATYLRLTSFMHDYLSDVMKNEISRVEQEIRDRGVEPSGLVLDLRGNGGGSVDQVDRVLSIFMKSGTVFAHKEGTQASFKQEAVASMPQGSQNGKPTVLWSFKIKYGSSDFFHGRKNVVVLVDRNSASAAEMTPAALHDYKKAWIVGERTFGKGVGMLGVSPPEPIGGDLSINNTYTYAPSGHSYLMDSYFIDAKFVDPVNEEQDRIISEAPTGNYPYGIEYDFQRATKNGSFAISKPAPPKQSLLPTPDEESWIDDGLAATLRAFQPVRPASCASTPATDKAFLEENDCLLDVGLLYLDRIVQSR